MNDELRSYFRKLSNNTIVKNLLALGFFQFTNYLLPILLIPYLIRTIGIEKFGLVSLSQAIMSIFITITDYSFNFTSTREASLNRLDRQKLSDIYSVTILCKVVLGLLACVTLIVCLTFIPKLRENAVLHLFGFVWVTGNLLFPVWLYQGLEKMQYITYLNLLSKVITFLSILIFVRKPEDFIYVLPCYGIGLLSISIISLQIVKSGIGLVFRLPSFPSVLKSLIDGSYIFFVNASITLYSSTTLIILGAFSSDLYVGYYSVAEKVMLIPRQLLGVFSQAIYPQVCQQAEKGIANVNRLWKSLLPYFYGIVLAFCSVLFFFSDEITVLIVGEEVKDISVLIRFLLLIPVIVGLNIPSYLTLMAKDLKKDCLKVLLPASIFNMAANAVLSYYMNAIGTSIALIITEVIVTVGLLILVRRKVYGIVFK